MAHNALDLRGQKFGFLTALFRLPETENRYFLWECRCDCGKHVQVSTKNLTKGIVKSCGCQRSHQKQSTNRIKGKRFGRLIALTATKKRSYKGSIIWQCKCDCGNITEASADALLHGNKTSCGCRKNELKNSIHDQLTFVDSTCIEWLRSRKNRKDNTSGFRGVYESHGKWRVSIGFKKRRYYYGTYDTFEQAKAARLEIEKILHDDFIAAWEKWLEASKDDPEWAETHPFEFNVQKVNGKITIQSNILDSTL
ncbi:MAG: hypothetical protein IKD83_05350 [Firmicutes bacterium]|nr:hypothetical protein [Bacillota bacterium]